MTPTLFSVSYAGLWGQHRLDLESFIDRAARLGYPAVELMAKRPHLSVLDTGEEALVRLRERADSRGVAIATLASYCDFNAGAETEIPLVEIQLSYIERLARMAETLGARIIRVFTGYCRDEANWRSEWDRCVGALRECARIAADHGVVIGVQNHHDTAVSAGAFREFLAEVDHPACRASFDPWAPALHGDDLEKRAEEMAPLMVQTTLADYVRLERFAYQPGLVNYRRLPDIVRAVPLGEGFVDLEAFFRGLRKGGFDGLVAYEMCSPLRGGGSGENLDRTARAAREYIEKLAARD